MSNAFSIIFQNWHFLKMYIQLECPYILNIMEVFDSYF